MAYNVTGIWFVPFEIRTFELLTDPFSFLFERGQKTKIMYKGIDEAKKLNYDQLVICRCPEWNDEGYQIATWNGVEFEFSGQPNDMFNDLVIAFLPIDEEGEIYPSFYDGYNKFEFRKKALAKKRS